jgi:signal peptidase I
MKKNVEKIPSKKKSALHEWIESAVVALILAIIIRTFVIQAFKIPTGSMEPTLHVGDAILVNKFLYGARIPFTPWKLPAIRQPASGDIIVFIYPEDPKKDFIKRLVAKGGETVEIRNGTIYINDVQITNPAFDGRYYYNKGEFGDFNKKIVVPEGSYFVLGDNSFTSQDSRYWGFVPEKNIRGKAIIIYWPLNRLQMLK